MDKKITQLPAAASVTLDDLIPIVDDPGVAPVTQKATVQQFITLIESLDVDYFNLSGTDYIGGDQTGNARGGMTVDVSSQRSNATEVASGNLASCFGQQNTASGASSQAIGSQNLVAGAGAMGLGVRNTAGGISASAFGYMNDASGNFSAAFGYGNTSSGISSFGFGYHNTASGLNCAAFGYKNTASGDFSSAFGWQCIASVANTAAVGFGCTASGVGAISIGASSGSSGVNSSAFGQSAVARIDSTTNICGPQIIRKDNGEGVLALNSFCGVQTVLMTVEMDLKTPATTTLTLPAGCHFWIDEIFLIDTVHNTVSVQPFISLGITGTNNKYLNNVQTTLLTAALKREIWLVGGADGETTLTATIVTGSTATAHSGRFGFKGILIEDE